MRYVSPNDIHVHACDSRHYKMEEIEKENKPFFFLN